MVKYLIIGTIIGIFTAMLMASCSGKGIVILEGYEHGVAFCENHTHSVIHNVDHSTWNDGLATYVVNKGHYKDTQVKELVSLAQKQCKQYQE